MIVLLSPAKTMHQDFSQKVENITLPVYLDKTQILADALKKLGPDTLSKMMKVNAQLAQLNHERFQRWHVSLLKKEGVPALFSYQGEVFRGLDAQTLSKKDLMFAQEHLRILSGFYGVLRPLDQVLPYRLEIGGKFIPDGYRNLYDFWREDVSRDVLETLNRQKDRILIHLASAEYFKVLDLKKQDIRIITPVFKESRGNGFKMVTVYAKKARGMMARFIIRNQVTHPDKLKLFDEEGYFYNERLSTHDVPVFTR
ncbi:peroxide stress protein YaaA [Candidatus Sulfidibacterium hydrothermale]|uniref:peroxide stress protein YaaA n=1 Tax=Candidatus Sulfidibacterium hydrothermale TaxID=2875962 RepID=UPI001F0B2A4A|nr:peroxide stress protein YaaA [Candidatus Sulfidibacterium hydrothermale]UBM62004.1 peroxide stress protein YaaA [Candidatus Sulfidibacterium hydrothermale]